MTLMHMTLSRHILVCYGLKTLSDSASICLRVCVPQSGAAGGGHGVCIYDRRYKVRNIKKLVTTNITISSYYFLVTRCHYRSGGLVKP